MAINGNPRNEKPTKILTTKITKLEKLHDNKLEAQKNVGKNQWNIFLWSQQKHIEKKFEFGDYVIWFPR